MELSQFEEGNLAYHMPGVYEFEGDLDVAVLEKSFVHLIKRHEILRTFIKEGGVGEVRQFIKEPEAVDFSFNIMILEKIQIRYKRPKYLSKKI